ncbi:MAG: Maf family nucleotide pyrophosphatase [Pseudomonadota bacterium]
MKNRFILASGSQYRRELLERLRLSFEVIVPNIDETPLNGETASALAARLGAEKCLAVAQHHTEAWVIGSDQVASCEGQFFGKPGTHECALEQLKTLRGKTLDLHTAMSVWNPKKQCLEHVIDHTRLKMADLPGASFDAYLRADQPYQCAASAKIESMGIGLLDELQTNDPTAIIGLPLIALVKLLRVNGVDVFMRF